jgi:hypothetical protein
MGSALGRRRRLSPGVGSVASVASWFGRNVSGFSHGADGFRLGQTVCMLKGAGQGWRRGAGGVPSLFGCGAGQGDARAHGNTTLALGALGGLVASGWHGRGAAHGWSGTLASRGINHWGEGETSGEVIARGGVGAVLSKMGVHSGHVVVLRRGWGRSSMPLGNGVESSS